ncbi:FKBP-type peptidyl-prolyl cis-trans isomerase [Pedobacter sp. GR22-6]|uniref:FKBP-type peptidyl-prolyl cis-trans isomerase n=1 Tax=Pedobacter sp. GR22-6 TaxID=3127957 RepID=UPI00307F25A1
MKIKYLIVLVALTASFAACKKGKPLDVEAQFKADTTAIRSYVTANNISVKKTSTGIFYQVIAPGSGSVNYSKSTQISADYQGKIMDGSVFDDSKGTPVTFPLGGVIEGWQIGIPLIQKGGKIRLFIPSFYGYGASGSGPIPPNSILDFNITLVNVQ